MTHSAVYNTSSWRDLPRDYCCVSLLLGDAVGPCRGLIHHHHVDPTDPDSRTVQCCQIHHNKIHAILRGLRNPDGREVLPGVRLPRAARPVVGAAGRVVEAADVSILHGLASGSIVYGVAETTGSWALAIGVFFAAVWHFERTRS